MRSYRSLPNAAVVNDGQMAGLVFGMGSLCDLSGDRSSTHTIAVKRAGRLDDLEALRRDFSRLGRDHKKIIELVAAALRGVSTKGASSEIRTDAVMKALERRIRIVSDEGD
jgi:hypothetical protein